MLTREQAVKLLQEKRRYLAAEFGVSKIGLFGSYARGRSDETSGVDILIEFERPIGLRFARQSFLVCFLQHTQTCLTG
ncbi:MAG: nucleotidyltransferase domain-containing protein [Truepera sp.]|nr:nucleotidyltransferase domain-containing protein [Truepera sp.]